MRKTLMMTFLGLLLLAGAAPLLSACNTPAGFGKDMSSAGQAIDQGAESNK
jgi:predicted small secreted protein